MPRAHVWTLGYNTCAKMMRIMPTLKDSAPKALLNIDAYSHPNMYRKQQ